MDAAAVQTEADIGVKAEPNSGSLLPHGETLGSAIVLDGLPEEAIDATNEDVEWE